ncbi:MAG TPA: hypothetical protein VHL98_06325 [Microvirga sp.]|jgi:hypothetical protein|nr:hypothetical protein [Microvirga sp.]
MFRYPHPALTFIGAGLAALAASGLVPGGAEAWPLALAGVAALAPAAARHDPDLSDAGGDRPNLDTVEERQEGAWRVYPLDGAMQLAYRDVAGNPSLRRILARELKVGPGKVLLGGIDAVDDGYRGFRADRIDLLVDVETGQTVDRNILDWLVKRALQQAKQRRKGARREADRAE